jgi:lipid A 4'-phosphatase
MSRPATPQFELDRQDRVVPERRSALGVLGKNAISAVGSPAVWIPSVVLVVLTIIFRWTDADMALVGRFFAGVESGKEFADRWPLMEAQPWKALYDWGVYPAWILGGGGLLLWIVSFPWQKLEPWRDEGLFYGLLLIIGPGLIINGALKPYWGRPRPNNIVPFGGDREFLPVWEWGRGQDESSFPSGHASTGFYLMAPAFVYYRRRRRLALAFLVLGLISGSVMGLARVVAGGHFPSDVVWAGGIVYFTALLIAAPFRFGDEVPPFWKRAAPAVGRIS